MHQRVRLTRSVTRWQCVLIGSIFSVMFAGGVVLMNEGGYNSDPTYCHGHSAIDILWWYNQCWLPDPPGGPY